MTPWINITVTQLRDTEASSLIDAYQTVALGDTQTDPVPRKINSVCDRIRARIQDSGKYQVSATPHSIPPSLFDLAARLIAWTLRGRLNVIAGSFEPTRQQEIDHANDEKELERISRGEATIEVPDDPIATPETQSGGATEQVSGGCRTATREKMDGL